MKNLKMKLSNQTGCFENKTSKAVVIVNNGEVLSLTTYGNVGRPLIDLSISQLEEWQPTDEYMFIPRDEQKGWNQPGTGLRHKSGINYMSANEKARMITVDAFIKILNNSKI